MKPFYHRIILRLFAVQVVFSLLLMGLAQAAESARPDTAFFDRPGVMTTDLKEQSLNDLEIPSGAPLSIRKIKDSENPVVLQGEVAIGNKNFIAITSVECDGTVFLYEKDAKRSAHQWEIEDLYSMNLDGRYYDFAVLDGRKLAVCPYSDSIGEFSIIKPDPAIEHLDMMGMLKSDDSSIALFEQKDRRLVPPREYILPVGDYYPHELHITCDKNSIDMVSIFDPKIQEELSLDAAPEYWFQIRKDKLAEVRFAKKPEVLFLLPSPDQNAFKPGQDIVIQAYLMDPSLHMLITNYTTSVRMERELNGQTIAAYNIVDGELQVAEREVPLRYRIKIARENGDVIVEDAMDCHLAYTWTIPEDIELSEDEKPWIVTLTWDTSAIYGTVTSQTQITVSP